MYCDLRLSRHWNNHRKMPAYHCRRTNSFVRRTPDGIGEYLKEQGGVKTKVPDLGNWCEQLYNKHGRTLHERRNGPQKWHATGLLFNRLDDQNDQKDPKERYWQAKTIYLNRCYEKLQV